MVSRARREAVLCEGAYTDPVALFNFQRSDLIMGKSRESVKEAKKQPAKTVKEKKAAKQAKKHPSDNVPIIPPGKV